MYSCETHIKEWRTMKKIVFRPCIMFAVIVVVFTMLFYCGNVLAEKKGIKALPRLVDVGADKCVPCIMMAPILEELKKEYAGVLDVEFVDVWKNPQAGRQYGIRGIPTQIFYDANGKELKRRMGFISKQGILDEFKKLGIPLKPLQTTIKKGKS